MTLEPFAATSFVVGLALSLAGTTLQLLAVLWLWSHR